MNYEVQSPICPICNHRVSNWQIAGGKTIVVEKRMCHSACAFDEDVNIKEIERRVKEQAQGG